MRFATYLVYHNRHPFRDLTGYCMDTYACRDIYSAIWPDTAKQDIEEIALTYRNLHVPLRIVVANKFPEYLDYLDQLLLLQ
jgi:hypothetical protein